MPLFLVTVTGQKREKKGADSPACPDPHNWSCSPAGHTDEGACGKGISCFVLTVTQELPSTRAGRELDPLMLTRVGNWALPTAEVGPVPVGRSISCPQTLPCKLVLGKGYRQAREAICSCSARFVSITYLFPSYLSTPYLTPSSLVLLILWGAVNGLFSPPSPHQILPSPFSQNT